MQAPQWWVKASDKKELHQHYRWRVATHEVDFSTESRKLMQEWHTREWASSVYSTVTDEEKLLRIYARFLLYRDHNVISKFHRRALNWTREHTELQSWTENRIPHPLEWSYSSPYSTFALEKDQPGFAGMQRCGIAEHQGAVHPSNTQLQLGHGPRHPPSNAAAMIEDVTEQPGTSLLIEAKLPETAGQLCETPLDACGLTPCKVSLRDAPCLDSYHSLARQLRVGKHEPWLLPVLIVFQGTVFRATSSMKVQVVAVVSWVDEWDKTKNPLEEKRSQHEYWTRSTDKDLARVLVIHQIIHISPPHPLLAALVGSWWSSLNASATRLGSERCGWDMWVPVADRSVSLRTIMQKPGFLNRNVLAETVNFSALFPTLMPAISLRDLMALLCTKECSDRCLCINEDGKCEHGIAHDLNQYSERFYEQYTRLPGDGSERKREGAKLETKMELEELNSLWGRRITFVHRPSSSEDRIDRTPLLYTLSATDNVVWWETLWPILRGLHNEIGLGAYAFPYGRPMPLSREWAIVSEEQYAELRRHFQPALYFHGESPTSRRQFFFQGVSIHHPTDAADKITTIEEARRNLLLTRWESKTSSVGSLVSLVVLGDLIYPEMLDDEVLKDEEILNSLQLADAERWSDAQRGRNISLFLEKTASERRRGTPEQQAEDEKKRAENSDYDRDHCTDKEKEQPQPRNDEDHLTPKITRRAQRKAKLVFNIPAVLGPSERDTPGT